ncbi:MAG: Holliday junction DNA helicase RuvA [Lentimonas sp.]|jgi:Holliday junction DNA helicase RuvA
MVVLDVAGVGYEIHIPVTTAEKVPAAGNECCLFIHSVYREDNASLYGFADKSDRDFFRLLIEKVSGIGPKIGIAILSRMSVENLRNAIAHADVTSLSKCPGIGKKTAERLVIELKDKVGLGTGSPGSFESSISVEPNTYQDAVNSLIVLGYKQADAEKLIRKASSQLPGDANVEIIVKQALS